MKKIFFALAVHSIGASVMINLVSCNTINEVAKLNSRITNDVMREHKPATPENRNEISIQAVRNFINEFSDAQNVSWRKTNDGGYIAEYTKDSVKTLACYDYRGYAVYAIRKYNENKMPRAIRAIIRSNFFDHAIMEVSEIKLPGEDDSLIYRVLIQNASNFKILRISNYEMEIIGDYTKP